MIVRQLLLLNGVGYSVLLGARFLPMTARYPYHLVVSGITVVYALVTIFGYFLMHEHLDILGLVTKATEVALISIVALQLVRSSSPEPITT